MDREFAAGHRSTLVVLPTGTGKTIVFAEVVRRELFRNVRSLVVAHRTELIEQAVAKLADVGIRAAVDQGGSRASLDAPVVVGSVQTLRGARLERYAPDHFGLVVVDEAHHAAAASYKAIPERFARAHLLGVTATPNRADGRALGAVFETVAFTYELRRAIREKFLAPIRARRVTVADLDLSAIRSHHGDLDQGALAKMLVAEKALHGVVSPLLQLAGAKKTLVFGVDVAHAKAMAEVLNRHRPGSALAVDGSAKAAERRAALALFRENRVQFLVNCALYTEGFDEPSIECVAMARPTLSHVLYTQMIGRGTRLFDGKPFCSVLDFVGNSGRHRLVGPADALAGAMVPDEIRDDVDGALERGQIELEDVLSHAEDELAKRREKVALVAVAHYRTKEVDPFVGDFMPPIEPDSPLGRQPATERQIAAIEAAGLSKPPAGFTKGEASRILDAVAARARAGLCTVPQARVFEGLGIDTRILTMARAKQLFAKCRAIGFKPWVLRDEPEARRGAVRR